MRPDLAAEFGCESGDAIRAEIARVGPRATRASRRLRETGDAIQVGGARLCEGGDFPTPDGQGALRRGRRRTTADVPDGRFVLSTRRGKQFNSMVWKDVDPLTGAAARRAVRRRRRRRRRSASPTAMPCSCAAHYGEIRARVHLAPIRPGNVQAFFPEANPLLAPSVREPISGVPDYNAVVEVIPVG